MPTLKSQFQALAEQLAAGIVAAARNASLEEILGGPVSGARGPGRPKKALGGTVAGNPGAPPKSAKRNGRLARRSPDDIQKVVGLIVAKLKEHRAGLRSEQLQNVLKLHKNEITRPIEFALAAKKIVKTGKKRSTTYFAAK